MTMTTDFIGKGLAVRRTGSSEFGLRVDGSGGWATSAGDDKVAQSIELILRTSPGDRPMRPLFGCPLRDFVFAPNNGSTHSRLSAVVRQSVEQWEPRVTVIDVIVNPDSEEQNCLLLDIHYQLKADNDARNLVFPFYIIPEES